jgi:hypothetical protein
MVGISGSQYRIRINIIFSSGSDWRFPVNQLRLHQRVLGNSGRWFDYLYHQFSD